MPRYPVHLTNLVTARLYIEASTPEDAVTTVREIFSVSNGEFVKEEKVKIEVWVPGQSGDPIYVWPSEKSVPPPTKDELTPLVLQVEYHLYDEVEKLRARHASGDIDFETLSRELQKLRSHP